MSGTTHQSEISIFWHSGPTVVILALECTQWAQGWKFGGLSRGVFACFCAPGGQRQVGEPAPLVRALALGTDHPQPLHTNLHFSQLAPLQGLLREMEGDSA